MAPAKPPPFALHYPFPFPCLLRFNERIRWGGMIITNSSSSFAPLSSYNINEALNVLLIETCGLN